MKKLILSMFLLAATGTIVTAQNKAKTVKTETKTTHTSTIPEKVHNTFSKHKHYNGKKTTHKKVTEKKSKS